MKTSHHADGPGSRVRPGPGAHPAFFANDNRALFPVPVAGERGLVLATETGKDGSALATIRMLVTDGTLSAPLHTTREPWDIIALWRGLGRDLDLQLFLRDISGALTPIAPLAGEIVFAHRRGSALSARRPGYVAGRKVPMAGITPAKASGCRRKG